MVNSFSGHSLILLITLIIISGCNRDIKTEQKTKFLNPVPSPKKTLNRGGENRYSKNFWIIADVSDSTMSDLASFLAQGLAGVTNEKTLITDLYSTRTHNQSIRLELNPNLESGQGYNLDLTSSHIKIEARTSQGIFYGIQTMLQILISTKSDVNEFIIPSTIISDSPSQNIRGVLVSPAQLDNLSFEKLLSMMASLKLNSLIIDNDVSSYPKLNRAAANYFVRFLNINDLASDISVVNCGNSIEDIENFYSSYLPSKNNAGMVLDLRSTEGIRDLNKLLILAEITWTNSANRSLDNLREQTRSIE